MIVVVQLLHGYQVNERDAASWIDDVYQLITFLDDRAGRNRYLIGDDASLLITLQHELTIKTACVEQAVDRRDVGNDLVCITVLRGSLQLGDVREIFAEIYKHKLTTRDIVWQTRIWRYGGGDGAVLRTGN